MDKNELIERLIEIKEMGFVQTKRVHDTGIGYTLEHLLGIKENNIQMPDVGELELKAKRIGSESMLTIATKSPLPKGVNRVLYNEYKYLDIDGDYCLHSTVYSSRDNQQGFRIVFDKDKLVLKNNKDIKVYWPLTIFDDILKAKSDKIILVFATTKGRQKSNKEQFHFTEAYLLSTLNIDKFKSAIEDDKLKIDIRIGTYKSGPREGRYHDHGTGFRIHKSNFLHLYDKFDQLI